MSEIKVNIENEDEDNKSNEFSNSDKDSRNNSEKNKVTILLAEDDEFIRDIYNRIFKMNGYEVVLATNGLEAMKKMEKITPDLILLDVMMPYQNGKEVFKKIKKDDRLKNIPVVFLTNVSAEDDIEKELLEQADKYLIKAHFTPKEVVAEVALLLKNKNE